MERKFKFGIIGTGRMAETMMEAFKEVSNIEVMAVCSTSPARAREFAQRFGIKTSYADLMRFLCNDDISVVYIANRNVEHSMTAIAALNAGKAVLCEKPFAINVKEGQAVLFAARDTRQLFMEAMWTPFLPAYGRLLELVQSGSFGKPTHVHFEFGYPTSAKINPLLFAPNGGGVLLDRSGYGIALALSVLGDVALAEAALTLNKDGVDVNACLQLTHRTGGQSQLGLSLTSLMANTATVACENGMVGLLRPTIGSESVFFQHQAAHRSPRMDANGRGLKQQFIKALRRQALARRINAAISGPTVEYHPFGVNPYVAQVRHFIELLRTGRSESNVNTMDSSLAALKIIDAAKASTMNRTIV